MMMTREATEETRTNLFSDDHTLVQKAAEGLRRILSVENNPPIKMVIHAGFLPRLAELLSYDFHPSIQFEAAWALTNIASGDSDDTKAIVNANICPQMIRLMSSSESEDVRKQCAWTLGNIAGDSLLYRDMLLDMGVLPALLTIFDIEKNSRISTIRTAAWILTNIFKEQPAPSKDNIAMALPFLARLIFTPDIEIVTDACLSLSYISDGPDDQIQMVLNHNIAPKLSDLLNSGNSELKFAALKTTRNIFKVLKTKNEVSNEITASAIDKIDVNRLLLSIGNLLDGKFTGKFGMIRKEAKGMIIEFCSDLSCYSSNGLLHEIDLDFTDVLMNNNCLLQCAHKSRCDEVGYLLLALDSKKYAGTKYE